MGVSLEVFLGEGAARAGFQVPFESVSLLFILECNVVLERPRPMLGGVKHFSSIMLSQAGFQSFEIPT
jgi:hypothetical protein